jgi:hypothetical protein
VTWGWRYLLALLPAAVTLGGWQLALFGFYFFGCQGDIKHMKPCFAGGVGLLPFMGIGLFWFPLLSFMTVPASVGLLTSVAIQQAKSKNARNES